MRKVFVVLESDYDYGSDLRAVCATREAAKKIQKLRSLGGEIQEWELVEEADVPPSDYRRWTVTVRLSDRIPSPSRTGDEESLQTKVRYEPSPSPKIVVECWAYDWVEANDLALAEVEKYLLEHPEHDVSRNPTWTLKGVS